MQIKHLIEWIRLTHQADEKNGQARFYDKQSSRIYYQLLQEKRLDTDRDEKSCLNCGKFSKTTTCNDGDCAFCTLNKMYIANLIAYNIANTEYKELVRQRKEAWQRFIGKNKQ